MYTLGQVITPVLKKMKVRGSSCCYKEEKEERRSREEEEETPHWKSCYGNTRSPSIDRLEFSQHNPAFHHSQRSLPWPEKQREAHCWSCGEPTTNHLPSLHPASINHLRPHHYIQKIPLTTSNDPRLRGPTEEPECHCKTAKIFLTRAAKQQIAANFPTVVQPAKASADQATTSTQFLS